MLCDVVRGLRDTEVWAPPDGGRAFHKVRDLPVSVAVLGHDQFYRGYTLVIARTHATELYDLADAERAQYLDDMVRMARAVAAVVKPRKMNYECLGNSVAHLHWHLFPRQADDPLPKRPIWEHAHPPGELDEAEAAALIAALRRHSG